MIALIRLLLSPFYVRVEGTGLMSRIFRLVFSFEIPHWNFQFSTISMASPSLRSL